MKEFNLSEKVITIIAEDEDDGLEKQGKYVYISDVKEFIRLLKEEIEEAQTDCANLDTIDKYDCFRIIDKLSGDKLK